MKYYLIFAGFLTLGIHEVVSANPMDGLRPLTDEEQRAADTYIHTGLSNQTLEQECGASGYSDLCTNDQNAFKGQAGQIVEQMLPIATQAYSMFSTVSQASGAAGGFSRNVTQNGNQVYQNANGTTEVATSPEQAQQLESSGAEKKTEEVPDYCQYIATATELASMAYQIIKQNQIQEEFQTAGTGQAGPSNQQVNSLHAIKSSQIERKKNAAIQSSGWGATAACYVGYMFSVNIDAKLVLKLSSATLLSTFFAVKARAHGERARAIQDIIDKLPDAGDCNPFTQTTCFCSHETSPASDATNFQKFCVPDDFKNRDFLNAYVCVDAQMKADPKCNCASSNSCFDVRLSQGALEVGLNPSQVNSMMQSLKPMSRGLGSADLDSATERNLAMARRALADKGRHISGNPNLSDSQRKMASAMNGHGIPANIASRLASNPPPAPGSLPASLSNVAQDLSYRPVTTSGSSAMGANSGLKFQGAAGSSGNRKRGDDFVNPFAVKKDNSGKAAQGSVSVEDFYKKAEEQASINTNKETPIFDIISNRYQKSLWKNLNEQGK